VAKTRILAFMAIERCPYCQQAAADEFSSREMMFGLRHSFVYRRCGGCGSLWLADPPTDMTPYYGDAYYSLATSISAVPIRGARHWANVILSLPAPIARPVSGKRGFPRYVSWFQGLGVSLSSRIADIGSGEGDLCRQLARHGFTDVWGYDPFIARERNEGALHLRRAGVEALNGQFDVIMFNHSLEHLTDPGEALRRAKEGLTPGGHILIRIPVAGSYADRHYGADWVALDPPRHLSVPSQRGMQQIAADARLRISRVFFDSQPLQFWASEQYQRDEPLTSESSSCGRGVLRVLRRRAAELNAKGEGDTAGYILQEVHE
jgi:SAM-dependent methyltransferase